MPPKFTCSTCKNSFYKTMVIDENASTITCLLCGLRNDLSSEVNALRALIEQQNRDHSAETDYLKTEIAKLKSEMMPVRTKSTEPTSSTHSDIVKAHRNSPSASLNHDFHLVKRGAKPARNPLDTQPLSTSNSFSALQIEEEDGPDDDDIVVVGDSMLRNQKHYFANGHQKRKVFHYNGFSLTGQKPLDSKIDEFTAGSNSKSTFIIEIGTNDLLNLKHRITPSELVNKYRSLVQNIRLRSGSNNICILGLLPVLSESLKDINDRKLTNNRLSVLAGEENIKFVSWWAEFAHPPDYMHLFNKGGLHLSGYGDAKLAHLLNKLAKNFHPVKPTCSHP